MWPYGGMAYAVDLKSTVLTDVGVRVPLRLPRIDNCIVMKKNASSRNAYALLAKKRKAGKIRPKSEKRQNGKNKQREFLKEVDE